MPENGERIAAIERAYAAGEATLHAQGRQVEALGAMVGENARAIARLREQVGAMTGRISIIVAGTIVVVEIVLRYVAGV